MGKEATEFIAKSLIKQSEFESPETTMWIYSSMTRIVMSQPNILLSEYLKIFGQIAKDTKHTYEAIRSTKNLKTIE